MDIAIPSTMIISGILFVAVTQAVTLYRVSQLEKKFDNGINRKIDGLDTRLDTLEKECIKHHALDY